MEEFEYSWDFGERQSLIKENETLKKDFVELKREFDLRHIWVKHHQKSSELSSTRERLTQAKFDRVIEKLAEFEPEYAKELKNMIP